MFTLITAYIINYVTFLHATIETEPENDIIIVSFPNKISRSARNSFARPPYEPTPSPFPLQLPCSAPLPCPSPKDSKNEEHLRESKFFPVWSDPRIKFPSACEWTSWTKRAAGIYPIRSGVNTLTPRSDLVTHGIYRYRLSVGGRRGTAGGVSLLSARIQACGLDFFFFFLFFFFSFLRVGERLQIDERVCVYPVYIERGLGRYR